MSPRSIMNDSDTRQRFREMWAASVTCDEMAVALGLGDDRHVRKWRKKLGLPERGTRWTRRSEVQELEYRWRR